jgi:chaperonin GroEL (HSP60 family)
MQPSTILKRDRRRLAGSEAQRTNILATSALGEFVKPCFGPTGRSKVIIDDEGKMTVTSDGITLLEAAKIENPVAKVMVAMAKSQYMLVGDGTITVTLFASELLRKSEQLLEHGVHPTTISAGIKRAVQESLRILNQISESVDRQDRAALVKVAKTALASKSMIDLQTVLSDIATDAVVRVAERRPERWVVDITQIKTVKKTAGSIADSRVVRGVILDKEIAERDMPLQISDARIVIVNSDMNVASRKGKGIDFEIRINEPHLMKSLMEEQNRILDNVVERIRSIGANVVLCQKDIDRYVARSLAKLGILAVKRISKVDLELLSKATGGNIVENLDNLTPNDLGFAKSVEETKIANERTIIVEGCRNPKVVSILVCGGFARYVEEAARILHDALSVVADVYEVNRVVAGGGAMEMELSKRLMAHASQISSREQLGICAFAEALEVIPKTLAENAGLHALDVVTTLRAVHKEPDGVWYGIDVVKGKVEDMMKNGVIEPLSVKEYYLKHATEVVSLVLRIDDVIVPTEIPRPRVYGGASSIRESKPQR